MRVSQEAENALFALFAVKQGLVSETAVERALGKLEPGGSLSEALVSAGRLNAAQAAELRLSLNAEVFPGYRIEAEAGRGGMGVVYRARQLSMDRPVALKVLTRRLSQDVEYVEKFLVEARSAAKLNHEHIVAAIDAGSADDLHYFAMEFVDGCSVADLLDAEERLPWERAFEIGEQIGRALGHAHQAGLVHRDVKPENVLVTSEGEGKLCDLGLAKPSQVAGTGEKADMTEGTPYYCSPEQALGRTDIDPRSDVYSLGVTIYTMIVGEPPFDGDSPRAILLKQVKEPFPDLAEKLPDVPEPLRALIAEMVVKDRTKRLESMEAFGRRYAEALRGPRASARLRQPDRQGPPWGAIAGGVALLAGVGVVLALSLPGEDPAPSPSPEASALVEPSKPAETPSPRGPVRVAETPATSAGGTSSGGDVALLKAKEDFEAAVSYAKGNAQDPGAAAQRFREVAAAHPGTDYATRAVAEAERLSEEANRSAQRALDALSHRVLALLGEARFREAAELVETFRATWDARASEPLKERLSRIQAQVERQADLRASELSATLAKSPDDKSSRDELRDLAPYLSAAARARVETALGAARAARSEGRWDDLVDELLRALTSQGLAAGEPLIAAALKEPLLASRAETLREIEADLRGAREGERSLERGLRGLADQPEVTLRLLSDTVLKGRVVSWEFGRGGRFLAPGAEERLLGAQELAPEELLRWVLPPVQGRANAYLFLARGLPEAAALAYARYGDAGGPKRPFLAERVEAQRQAACEAKASAALQALLAAEAPGKEVLSLAGAFPERWRRTVVYRRRYPELQAAYVRARSAQLAEDPATLFKGSAKQERRGKLTLSYDFKDSAQLGDFRASPTHHKDSLATLKDEVLSLKGLVFVEARWLPDSLKVSFKAVEWDYKAPNLNIWLGAEAGAWQGVLCGVGLSQAGVDSLKIDTEAKKRAGYVVDLPCHAVIVLSGKPLERRMGGVLGAEQKPSVDRGKYTRVSLTRTDSDWIKVKVGSRIPLSVRPVPGVGQPLLVALAPLDSTIQITELELSGELDPVWAQERGQVLAGAEAKALPPPIQ